MEQIYLLRPVVALAAWTMVMWAWLYATRLPAMRRAGIDATTLVGTTGKDLDAALPPTTQWKAHNYNHLMEQPTVFYAVVLAMVAGQNWAGVDVILAWTYVGFRVVHSLVQALSNRVLIRFILFLGASLALIGLIARAVGQILFSG